MSEYIIGVSAYYHDSSACLFKNGELVFACEEERFTGIKHDSSFPQNTVDYIFNTYGLKKKNIKAVCYYEDPQMKEKRVVRNAISQLFRAPIYSIKSIVDIKRNRRELEKRLSKISNTIFYSPHHESHQHYSFYTSRFKRAICLSVDGVGEFDTVSVGLAHDGEIETFSLAEYPHSLGLYYSAMTAFLGFKPNEGEYKVMGLASYGNPQKYIKRVRKLIKFNGSVKCNMDVFCWNRSHRAMFNSKLPELLSMLPRLPEEEITTQHKDLAAAVQLRYEEVLFDVLGRIKHRWTSNLCLSGGCAYNGTANGKITKKTRFKNLWIPSAPSDAGSSVGACAHYLHKHKKPKNPITQTPFLGPRYTSRDAHAVVKPYCRKYFTNRNNLYRYVADRLFNGDVVGWFQGRMEFGARALGNRSILANPTLPGMKDKINQVIKKREGFRPFAPMVVRSKQDQYFHMSGDIPYMNQVVGVRPEYREILSAVTHVDGTARVQTVYENNSIHSLLIEFEKRSGVAVLLNTSFNVKDKTIVLTPKDAVETFFDTDMDVLVIGNYVIEKKMNNENN